MALRILRSEQPQGVNEWRVLGYGEGSFNVHLWVSAAAGRPIAA
jgi:hypothetical protein